MISSFFKLFLSVREMARSVAFYDRLGLELVAYRTRAVPHVYQPVDGAPVSGDWTRAVFWIDRRRTQQLFLALATAEQPWSRQHIAFDVDLADMRGALNWIHGHGLAAIPDFGREPVEPIMHNWIPAASLIFADPDGHQIELSARLPGKPIPRGHLPLEREPLYLSEWERLRATLDREASP